MNFTKYAVKGNHILDELAEELGFPEDRKLSLRILRSTLHVLRRRLKIEESFQLMAQLPFVIKALYVDSWKYQSKPERIKTASEFVRKVIHEDYPVGHHDFQTAKDGENAVKAVFKILAQHVSDGEMKDIAASLPEDIRTLLSD